MTLNKLIASFLGVGNIGKGAGSAAALITMLLWYWCYHPVFQNPVIHLSICGFIFLIGVYSSGKVELILGHDSNQIVIDEVLGMCIGLLFVPHQLWMGFTAFVIFRIFDIWKPLYIKKTEKLKGGFGVMTDDLVAGIYTLICIHIFLAVIK